jgi:Na+/H+ antiporter NhaD/arsenite permease-like protein
MLIPVLFGVFILGYSAISFEHVTRLDKLIPALLMMCVSWVLIVTNLDSIQEWFSPSSGGFLKDYASSSLAEKRHIAEETLLHHFGKTAEILIFLIGAMTIVEMIDYFDGFALIKNWIKTRKKIVLLWITCLIAFLLSAIIDNLTATIVLITILRKLIQEREDRLYFTGFIIIAANAGGAWTPIGDVTTTMLWIAGKITTFEVMKLVVLPSIVSIVVPLGIISLTKKLRGSFAPVEVEKTTPDKSAKLILLSGLILIIGVPIFKTITHLPPYLGMMFALALMAFTAEIVSKRKFKVGENEGAHHESPTLHSIENIEIPSILFFLGILMTVAALESVGAIFHLGSSVQQSLSENSFVGILGLISAVLDNVPLVAASIGMFDAPKDALIWHKIAYAAGTGGSILIIGSAAGVVAMGMEKIGFGWYLKNISWLALIGYISGFLVISML